MTSSERRKGKGAHVGYDSVDVGVGIAIAVLACCEFAKVAGGDGANGIEETKDDAACVGAVDLDIKLRE